MDFATRYTPEQVREREAFRVEVRAWLGEHADGAGAPVDPELLSHEQFLRNRAFLRKLGERGWYAPTWPREYGGAGLTPAVAAVIREELEALIPNVENVHPPGDIGGPVAGALQTIGSEEQQRRFLPPILRGEVVTWELHTEPEAGSDLPSLKSRAERQGDEYILNGTKTFVGGHFACDSMFMLAITDPQAPRRENLSAFITPADLPGMTVTHLDMLAGSRKCTIIFEDARVPAGCLIGKEGDGWLAFNSGMSGAFTVGIGPYLNRDERVIEQVLEFCRSASISADPDVQDALARIYVDFQVQRMLRLRNEWLASTGAPMPYEGAQTYLGRKLFGLKLAEAIHHALGPRALLRDPNLAPLEGALEYFHRYGILMVHPGGTVEIQKLRMFRGMSAGGDA
ncbi:MAG: acyl-CoA dehydrogenase family protein [Dehalococcoidia bacterium]